MYIDAGAYSSNMKQKLAAGSPLVVVMHRCVSGTQLPTLIGCSRIFHCFEHAAWAHTIS